MEIMPQPYKLSIDQAVLLGGKDEVDNTTQRMKRAYEELGQANEQMQGELVGDLRTCFFRASETSEKCVENIENRLHTFADTILELRRESMKINENASIAVGGSTNE